MLVSLLYTLLAAKYMTFLYVYGISGQEKSKLTGFIG